MKKILMTTTLALAFSISAHADETVNQDQSTSSTAQYREEKKSRISAGGLFLEPMISAIQEDSSIKTSQLPIMSDDTSGTSQGYGVGLRFGGHVSEVVFLGLDARYAKMRLADSFYNEADSDVYNIAPMLGFQTPLLGIRLMGAYVVGGENNPAAGTQGLNLKFSEPTGWRVGAGIHAGPVAINLEYQDLTYNKTEIESFGSVAVNSSTSVDAETKGYALSVGFPIEL